MPHVKVNGISINVTGSGEDLVRIGEITESFGGGMRRSVRSLKSAYTFTSALYALAEARALRAWLEGRGHAISLNTDFTTSRGLIATSSTGGSIGGSGKYGAYATFTAGSFAQWNALQDVASAPWSAAMWIKVSAVWTHHLVINDGSTTTTYVNGVLNGGFTPANVIARVGGNNRALKVGDLTSSGFTEFDDMVFWDFQLPATWAADVYAFHNAQAWSSLPDLFADGDAIQDVGATGGMTVLGQAGSATNQYFRSGASLALGQVFDFSLTEAQSNS